MSWKGERNFRRCQVKVVKLKNYYKAVLSGGDVWHAKPPKDGDYDIRVAAELSCPKTRSQDIDVSSNACRDKVEAVEELKMVADVTVCATCSFSRMDPVQLEEHEAKQLAARAQRIEAQNRLTLAEKEQERIRKLGEEELAEINKRHGIETGV